jgi:putative addiction module component (TIGR02574 family)
VSTPEITKLVLELPAEDRLELARKLVESVVTPAGMESAVQDGIRRIEDVLAGKVKGLTEAEFRATLG